MPDIKPVTRPSANASGPSIRVIVTNESSVDVDADRIKAAVSLALAEIHRPSMEVSVAIVDDPTIHELNRQFLEHNYPTDVLSFPLEDTPESLQGEIVVSVDTAERCAAEAGWSAAEELLLYVVHGALHLAGLSDKGAADADRMRLREAAVLRQLGIALSAQDSRWSVEIASKEMSP